MKKTALGLVLAVSAGRITAALALCAASLAAGAEPMVSFDISGSVPSSPFTSKPVSIFFQVPRAPAPVDDLGCCFHLDSVELTHNGVQETWDVTFHRLDSNNNLFGGLIVFRSVPLSPTEVLLNLGGPQLFSGPTFAPEFATGTFNLMPARSASIYQVPFPVTISEVSAPVPEPETYALLLAGLGLLGFAARRRLG